MARLVLVRHATPVPPGPAHPDDRVRPLTETGRQQAVDLVPTLAAFEPARIVSSPYARAIQTVEPTAAALGLEVETREACREWKAGNGRDDDWVEHCRRAWTNPTWSTPAGETHQSVTARAVEALFGLAAEYPRDTVIVGAHGCWTSRALHGLGAAVDFQFWQAMTLPAVFVLSMNPDRVLEISGPGIRTTASS